MSTFFHHSLEKQTQPYRLQDGRTYKPNRPFTWATQYVVNYTFGGKWYNRIFTKKTERDKFIDDICTSAQFSTWKIKTEV